MSNDRKTRESPNSRTGYGQTAYKRRLAYEHLGIDPKDVEPASFFRTNLSPRIREIARENGKKGGRPPKKGKKP